MAKHWKSFVKKEKAPKQENEEIANIASLISPEGKKSDKSLEDVAEFNSSLKSLIEEQKQLEDQMAELTGKKKESNTDKRYQHEIKSIDQKKKEEAAAAEKRKKRKESHRKKEDDRWDVTQNFNKKRKESTGIPPISPQGKKATPNTDFIQKKKAASPALRIPKVSRKPDTTLVSKKQKKATTLLEFGQKIQKNQLLQRKPAKHSNEVTKKGIDADIKAIKPRLSGKKSLDDFTKRPKKSVAEVALTSPKKPVAKTQQQRKTKAQKPTALKHTAPKPKTQKPKRQEKTLLQNPGKPKTGTPLQQKKKPVTTVSDTVKKGAKKLDSFVNNTAQKKEVQTLKSVAKKAVKAVDTFDTVSKKVSKVNDTFKTVQKAGNTLQSGIDKMTSVVPSSELQTLSKKVSKGMGIVNKVGTKLNKVDKLFNTANKRLEKTRTVTTVFEKKLNAVDFISGKDTKTKNGFDFDFIQQQQTKKEETKGFDVADKTLNVDFNTIKNIKKDIDTLKNVKKSKDSFAF